MANIQEQDEGYDMLLLQHALRPRERVRGDFEYILGNKFQCRARLHHLEGHHRVYKGSQVD